MDIYTYFFFSYGTTALIAVIMVCIIVMIDKIMHWLHADKSNGKPQDAKEI
jgi:hypothetical protein